MSRAPLALGGALLALLALSGAGRTYTLTDVPAERQDHHGQEAQVPGTVAHWRFAGPIGSVPADGTVIAELTGRFPGAVFGGPIYRRVGDHVGLEFTGLDDRIAVPFAPEFTLGDGMTLEAVIRYDGPVPGTLDQQQILFWGDDQPGMDPWFLAVSNEGYLMFHLCGDAGNRKVQLLSPEQLPTGRLVHVAGTLDGRNHQMRLYCDGKCVGSVVTDLRPMTQVRSSADPTSRDGFSVGIGNIQSASYHEGFNGLICEARIASRALNPDEMLMAPQRQAKAKRSPNTAR